MDKQPWINNKKWLHCQCHSVFVCPAMHSIQRNLRWKSVAAAILPSRREQSYRTSIFFFVSKPPPLQASASYLSLMDLIRRAYWLSQNWEPQNQTDVKLLRNALWPLDLIGRRPQFSSYTFSVGYFWAQRSCRSQARATSGQIAWEYLSYGHQIPLTTV